jgi:hypothetical protein
MGDNQVEKTREQKREERLRNWVSGEGIKFHSARARKAYQERATRLMKALLLEKPDRVPVMLPIGNFPAYYAGGNLKRAMYDYRFLREAWTKFMEDFKDDMDAFHGPGLVHSGTVLEILNYRLYKWPGHGLGENVNSYQFVEGEYMKADEYPALLKDPSDFALRVLLPRVVGSLEPLRHLPAFSSLLGMPMRLVAPFTRPEVRSAFKALIDAGKEMAIWQKYVFGFNRDSLAAGFPVLRGAMAVAPFDTIGDSLRGTQGVIIDMYRQPETLLEAIDMITKLTIEQTITAVRDSGGLVVSFPLHKGDDTFMSDKQFEKFYWPSLKKVIDALIDEGIMVFLFAEGKYNRRLEYIKDFPKGWVSWQFDQTDMANAKKIVGQTCCIWGNVPTSVMCTGTPQEVKEYCRRLIETCAPGGGYILTGGASATESNAANFKAMMAAAREYGRYQ